MELEVMYTPSGRVRTSFGYSANGSLTFTSTNPNGFIANNALKNNTKVLVEKKNKINKKNTSRVVKCFLVC